jgi:hypothetical protein
VGHSMEETPGERVLVCGNPWGSVPSKLDTTFPYNQAKPSGFQRAF